MSYDVSVFVSGLSADGIQRVLTDRFGVQNFTNNPSMGSATATVFAISISVIDSHDLDDDGGIEFSQYPQQVAFTLYAGRMDAESGQHLCMAMAQVLAKAIRDEGSEYLVVEGLQRLIERSIPLN